MYGMTQGAKMTEVVSSPTKGQSWIMLVTDTDGLHVKAAECLSYF